MCTHACCSGGKPRSLVTDPLCLTWHSVACLSPAAADAQVVRLSPINVWPTRPFSKGDLQDCNSQTRRARTVGMWLPCEAGGHDEGCRAASSAIPPLPRPPCTRGAAVAPASLPDVPAPSWRCSAPSSPLPWSSSRAAAASCSSAALHGVTSGRCRTLQAGVADSVIKTQGKATPVLPVFNNQPWGGQCRRSMQHALVQEMEAGTRRVAGRVHEDGRRLHVRAMPPPLPPGRHPCPVRRGLPRPIK